MNILHQICDHKRGEVAMQKKDDSCREIRQKHATSPIRPFLQSMQNIAQSGRPAIISEIKKASPSAGLIRADFDLEDIAKSYEMGGAACLSVLTDEHYFQGHMDYVPRAKAACALPVLRKEFIIDPYQIEQSHALGADCILLIMAALDDVQASDMYHMAQDLGMDVIVEIHDRNELDRAMLFTPKMIGVNSRNLQTQKTEFVNFEKLAPHLPHESFLIAESGITSADQVKFLMDLGYQGFLIGEYFMRQGNITQALLSIQE